MQIRLLRGLEGPPAGHGPGQGELIGVFEIAPHGQPVGGPGDPGREGRERSLEVERRRLALDVRVGGDDDLADGLIPHPVQQLLDVDLLRPDASTSNADSTTHNTDASRRGEAQIQQRLPSAML